MEPVVVRQTQRLRHSVIAHTSRWTSAPGRMLGLAGYAVAAVFLAALLTALAMPDFGARFDGASNGIAVTLAGRAPVIVPASARVTIASAAGWIAVPAATLVSDYQPSGTADAVARFYHIRDTIAQIAMASGASIAVDTATGPLAGQLHPRSRMLSALPTDFWLLTAQAALIALLGVWLRLNRPRDVASWIVGCACDGIFIAAMSGAVFDARELTAAGTLLRAMITMNYLGSNVSALGLTVLFLYVPRRLAPLWVGGIVLTGAVIISILEGLGVIPLEGFYLGLLVAVVAMVPILAFQVRATRGDPAGRAVLRWIGATALAGASLLCVGMAAPALLGLPSLASDGLSIIPVFLIYGGIAFGVGRARIFELDGWSYRLIVGAVAAMALVLVDMLIVNLLPLEGPVALSLTLLAAGYGYFPLRTLLWNRLAGGTVIGNETLFRLATLVAFSPGPEARRAEWRSLLDRVFEPVAIESHPEALTCPAIEADGAALLIPAIADDSALRLRFARRGRRLFGSAELTTINEILALVTAAESARAEYARGVNEERYRIARDLHDDVSSLLLTGLHRREVEAVRGDVRQALGEIRTMVSSLTQPEVALATILADLRFETAERLRAVGVTLNWRGGGGQVEEAVMLDYSRHKALVSGVREAVSNIVRHAAADAVAIDIAILEAGLTVHIADDGRGLNAQSASLNGGHGLASLNHRLEEVGGNFTLASHGRGCRASLVIPLPEGRAS